MSKVPGSTPEELTEHVGGSFFVSDDQTEVYYKIWKPSTPPVAVVLAFHGLGDHILRYEHVFERFAEQGILVKGMDYRGHGRTYWRNLYNPKVQPLKGYTHSYERIYKDMMLLYAMQVDAVNVNHLPTFVFGHSLGGLIALCFTYKCSHLIQKYNGTIAQAPAFKPTKAPPAILKWIALNLGGWIPRHLEYNQLDLQGLTSDPKVIEAYKQDAFVHDRISMQLAKDTLQHADMLMRHADKFTFPVLIYHAPEDLLTHFESTSVFYHRIASQDKFMKAMTGCFHELHNELGDVKWEVVRDYIEWIKKRL